MKKITNKSIKLTVVLSFILSLGLLFITLVRVNFYPAIPIVLIIYFFEVIISPLFFFLPNNFLSCGPIMPFSGRDACVPNLLGHILLFLFIFLIGWVILLSRYRKENNEVPKEENFKMIWKIVSALTILLLVISGSLYILAENNMERFRMINEIESRAVSMQNATICEEIPLPEDRDNCYLRVTIYNHDPSNCEKIISESYKIRCEKNLS